MLTRFTYSFSVTDSSQFFYLQRRKIHIYLNKPVCKKRALVLNHGIKSAQRPCFKIEHPSHSVTSFSFFVCFISLNIIYHKLYGVGFAK